MPRYDYCCDANGEVVEVIHKIHEQVSTWGEVCERSGIDPGNTDRATPVHKIFRHAPMANTPVSDSHLKNLGFTKLVKRDDGVYENVTRTGTESRYMRAGQPETLPHFHKKISD